MPWFAYFKHTSLISVVTIMKKKGYFEFPLKYQYSTIIIVQSQQEKAFFRSQQQCNSTSLQSTGIVTSGIFQVQNFYAKNFKSKTKSYQMANYASTITETFIKCLLNLVVHDSQYLAKQIREVLLVVYSLKQTLLILELHVKYLCKSLVD